VVGRRDRASPPMVFAEHVHSAWLGDVVFRSLCAALCHPTTQQRELALIRLPTLCPPADHHAAAEQLERGYMAGWRHQRQAPRTRTMRARSWRSLNTMPTEMPLSRGCA
jgi:hypothetical protein